MVLPYAEEIATRFNSELALFSVAEPAPAESDHLYRTYLKTIQEKVKAELSEWGTRPGTRVDVEVLSGKPPEEILTYAADKNMSLAVMASRGRSGEGPWLLGNIASRVLRATTKPVLLVRKEAPAGSSAQKTDQKDPSASGRFSGGRADCPLRQELAKVMEGEVSLFHVYESLMTRISGDSLTPLSKDEVREANKHREEEAKGYLKTVAGPLREKGLMASSSRATTSRGRSG